MQTISCRLHPPAQPVAKYRAKPSGKVAAKPTAKPTNSLLHSEDLIPTVLMVGAAHTPCQRGCFA